MSDEELNKNAASERLDPPAPPEPEQTPDNVIQLPEDPAIRALRRKRRRRILILAVLALVLIAVLLFVLLPDVFDLDAIRRYFYYMGKRDRDGYGTVAFEAAGTNDYAPLGDGFAVGTEGGLYYYDLDGEQQTMVLATVAGPRLASNENMALLYTMNSSYLSVINEKGEKLMDQTLGGMLLDVDLSDDGYICYNLTEDGYKTVTTVLGQKLTPIYRFRSSTQYLNACTVSKGGQYLAVAGLTEEGSSFTSTLTVLKTDEEIIAGTDQSQSAKRRISLGNEVVYELAFLSGSRLCVITQDALRITDTECNLIKEYKFETEYLRGYAVSEDGFVALLLGSSMTGDRYVLQTVDKNGEILGQIELDRTVRSLDVSGSYVGVLTDGELLVYRSRLQQPYYTTDQVGAAIRVCMRGDGTAMLVSNSEASLYIP